MSDDNSESDGFCVYYGRNFNSELIATKPPIPMETYDL